MARILVVEDDPDIVATVALALETEGHQVKAALGTDALLLAEAGEADLILLDLMLPLLPGSTIASYLHANPATARIPVIVASGLEGIEEPLRALGVRYYLRKPFGIGELVALVARALYENRKETTDGGE